MLEDSFLEYYDKRHHAHGRGGEKSKHDHTLHSQSSVSDTDSKHHGDHHKGGDSKLMVLNESSLTSFTDTENCFCVTTGSASWFLVAPDEKDMAEWIATVNAHIVHLRDHAHEQAQDKVHAPTTAPVPDARDAGAIDEVVPTFVRCECAPGAPGIVVRAHAGGDATITGRRLKNGDVAEITRRLTVADVDYVCLADWGWVALQDSDGETQLVDAPGTLESLVTADGRHVKYRVQRGALPILLHLGPSRCAQERAEALTAGEEVGMLAMFTHDPSSTHEDAGQTFLKLDNLKGWVLTTYTTRTQGSSFFDTIFSI